MSVEALKGQVRDLSTTYRSGQPKAFEAVRELAMLLLRLTIAHPYAHLMFVTGPNKLVRKLGVPGMPLPLNNGRFLRITAVLSLEETEHGTRLKVRNSGYQYQSDVDGDKWIIRYDYLRTPKD